MRNGIGLFFVVLLLGWGLVFAYGCQTANNDSSSSTIDHTQSTWTVSTLISSGTGKAHTAFYRDNGDDLKYASEN